MYSRTVKLVLIIFIILIAYRKRSSVIDFFRHKIFWYSYKTISDNFGEKPTIYGREEVFNQVSFKKPISISQSPLFLGDFFIAEHEGKIIKIDTNGMTAADCVLNFESKIRSSSENGFYTIAFHPKDSVMAMIYAISAKDKSSKRQEVISLMKLKDKKIDASSEKVLYKIPFIDHLGGGLVFDSKGRLFIGIGDGEPSDPHNKAQNIKQLQGKILLLKVDNLQVSIPTDNPFYNTTNALKEVWALGLRNPFRMNLGKNDESLLVGDVGHDKIEEINQVRKGDNCGWSLKEGTTIFKKNLEVPKLTEPIHQYLHGIDGFSVTGGLVYNGNKFPQLKNKYIFGDYVTGRIWCLDLKNHRQKPVLLLKNAGGITSFFACKNGNIFWTDFTNNKIYKLLKTQ